MTGCTHRLHTNAVRDWSRASCLNRSRGIISNCDIVCHLFGLAWEEPTLRRTFSRDYEAYRQRVSRGKPGLRSAQ